VVRGRRGSPTNSRFFSVRTADDLIPFLAPVTQERRTHSLAIVAACAPAIVVGRSYSPGEGLRRPPGIARQLRFPLNHTSIECSECALITRAAPVRSSEDRPQPHEDHFQPERGVMPAKANIGINSAVAGSALQAAATLLIEEGDHCRCGVQYQNGKWCTRMNGLGHEHAPRRPVMC